MILLELSTESGAVYVANVVHKRIRRISPEGDKADWADYVELQGGSVGESLHVIYPEGQPTVTTPVVKINHAQVD